MVPNVFENRSSFCLKCCKESSTPSSMARKPPFETSCLVVKGFVLNVTGWYCFSRAKFVSGASIILVVGFQNVGLTAGITAVFFPLIEAMSLLSLAALSLGPIHFGIFVILECCYVVSFVRTML